MVLCLTVFLLATVVRSWWSLSSSNLTLLVQNGRENDWSHSKNLIAFDKYTGTPWISNFQYNVYTIKPDGSDEKCLTCNNSRIPGHNGSPSFSPDGDYIIFTAENNNTAKIKAFHDTYLDTPGSGVNSDLWIISVDGKELYQLTDYPIVTSIFKNPKHAADHPRWSNDGKKIVWNEMYDSGSSVKRASLGGAWRLNIADLVWEDGIPGLVNITKIELINGTSFYESHQFFKDDKTIIFTADLDPNQCPDYTWDIYEYNYVDDIVTRLTSDITSWEEHSHYDPSWSKISFMSTRGYGNTSVACGYSKIKKMEFMFKVKAELWVMDLDGGRKQQITQINVPGSKEYIDYVKGLGKPDNSAVTDNSWSPDGKKMSLGIVFQKNGVKKCDLYTMDIEWEWVDDD